MMTCWRIPTSGPDFITTKVKKEREKEKKLIDILRRLVSYKKKKIERQVEEVSSSSFWTKSYYSNVMQSLPSARRCIDPNPPLQLLFPPRRDYSSDLQPKKLHIHSSSSRYCNDMSSSNEKNTTATVFFHIGSWERLEGENFVMIIIPLGYSTTTRYPKVEKKKITIEYE